jgi:hypothetical protein
MELRPSAESGGVGSHAWQATHTGQIEPNGTEGQVWYSHDFSFALAEIPLPYHSGLRWVALLIS